MPSRISEQAEMPACLSDFLKGNSGADQGFYQGTAACVIDADFAGLVLQTLYGARTCWLWASTHLCRVFDAAVGSVTGKNMQIFSELLQISRPVLVRHAQVFGQFASCIFKTKD